VDTHVVETGRSPQAASVPAVANPEPDEATHVFVHARPVLLKIASQIVGSRSEAEDVIQEAWLRWQGTDRAAVQNPVALLRATTVRLSINVIQSARRRREASASPWLPDTPDTGASPGEAIERREAVEQGIFLLMETLTPRQRAAYVLREGFGYTYDRIAGLLGLSIVNSRQQVSRAQERLRTRRCTQPVDLVTHRRLVQAFSMAAQHGDLACLEEVLSADACPPAHQRAWGPGADSAQAAAA